MFTTTPEYHVHLGIDGFWDLYWNNTHVYQMHDDQIPRDINPLEWMQATYEADVI